MIAVRALVAVATVVGAAPAAAQAVAVDPGRTPAAPLRSRNPHPPAGFSIGVALGYEHQDGFDRGWLARLDYDVFPLLTPRGRFGGYFGFQPSLQIWDSDDGWGVGIPFAIAMGVRAPGVRAGISFGFEAFSVEQLDDDTGVGLYQPLAGARVVLDLAGFYAGADARVTRRWQIGADDHTQWQASLVFGHTWETKLREPIR
jgi:hypothetical protein